MTRRWVNKDVLLNGTSVVVGASETNTVVSEVFRAIDPTAIIVDVTCSSVTVTNDVVIKVQDSTDKSTWNDRISDNTVATAGTSVSMLAAIETESDNTKLPLRPFCRVVVTSGISDAITIDKVMVATYE